MYLSSLYMNILYVTPSLNKMVIGLGNYSSISLVIIALCCFRGLRRFV